MERTGIHELSAAYALDALDRAEGREFERHLAHCAECREHVAGFQEAGAALAHATPAPAPPPQLRDRVLRQARAERGASVAPLRPRWAFRAPAAAAAVAACAALGLGLWAASLKGQVDDRAQVIALAGAPGSLVVQPSGKATLIVSGLTMAPLDKTYEAWVIEDGKATAAGLFQGGGDPTAVRLTRPVPDGAVVAVTLERAGGVDQPENDPLFTTREPV
ncbi:MAG: anti-sigma factor [Gaiellaceae bacterium]